MAGGRLGAAWAAASTCFSACLYLLDFGTTISALRTYYHYEFRCNSAPLHSALLRDPICRAIRSTHSLHRPPIIFSGALGFLALAHLTYAFIFWVSLDPRHHPLRLAYFMPLIHLYRLLKLFRHPRRSRRLTELQQSQRESNSLYNALGASLESAPQFLIQFAALVKLGEYVEGSSDPNMRAQRIPTNLVLSVLASMFSASYSASMGVSFLIAEHMPFARRIGISIMAGCQTLAALLAMAMNDSTLVQISRLGIPFPLLIYMIIRVIIAWIFICLMFQSQYCDSQGNNKYLTIAHTFGLALMTMIIGPIYVIVKHGKSSCLLIWGTLSHILIELVGLAFIYGVPTHTLDPKLPCQPSQITSMEEEGNKYLTCKLFVGTICLSIFVLILTTMLLVWIDANNDKNARDVPRSSTDIVHNTHNVPTSSNISTLSSIHIHSSKDLKEKHSYQTSTSSFFKLLLFVITIVLIQNSQKKYVLKS